MNERLLNMDPATWNDMKRLEGAILERLKSAMATGDPTGPEARELVRMHRHWVGLSWGNEPERDVYLGLVHGYLADKRFVDYYDSPCGEGATEFLVKAVDEARLA